MERSITIRAVRYENSKCRNSISVLKLVPLVAGRFHFFPQYQVWISLPLMYVSIYKSVKRWKRTRSI